VQFVVQIKFNFLSAYLMAFHSLRKQSGERCIVFFLGLKICFPSSLYIKP